MILEHNKDFSKLALAQAAAANRQRTASYIPRRADLRGKIAFTFAKKPDDPCDKCFTLYKTQGGWRLGVHIVDVAEFVCPDSPLDHEAYARTCALTTPFWSSPMLPKEMIEDCCNLKEGTDRLALSVLLDIDKNGELTDATLDESVVCVAKQCVYSETDILFSTADPSGLLSLREKYAQLAPILGELYELAGLLHRNRLNRGGIDIQEFEHEYTYTEDGKIKSDISIPVYDTCSMVQELLTFASTAVGAHLRSLGIPCVFVGQETPKKTDLAFFGEIFGLKAEETCSDAEYLSKLLFEATVFELFPVVCECVSDMMPPPAFSQDPLRDVCAAADTVVSFDSPTERYCDLLMQQLLKESISSAKKRDSSNMRRFLRKVDTFAAMANMVSRTAHGFLRSTRHDFNVELLSRYADHVDCGVVVRHGEARGVLPGGIIARFCADCNPSVTPEGVFLAGERVAAGSIVKASYVETDENGVCSVAPVPDVSRETSEEKHF